MNIYTPIIVAGLLALLVYLKRQTESRYTPQSWATDRGFTLFMLSGSPRRGRVVKRNAKTAWVEFTNGDVVKRHLRKHSWGGLR